MAAVPELTPEQLKQRIETGEPLQIIDVREPYEWSIGSLEAHGARLIPLGDFLDEVDSLDPETDLVVYCRTGKRSEGAVRHLLGQGFTRVWNLRGGILGWAESVDPSMPTY